MPVAPAAGVSPETVGTGGGNVVNVHTAGVVIGAPAALIADNVAL